MGIGDGTQMIPNKRGITKVAPEGTTLTAKTITSKWHQMDS